MHAREPDRNALTTFIETLFKYADDGSFVSLRAFCHRRDIPPPLVRGVQINGVGLAGVIEAAVEGARYAANQSEPLVFAPPVATFRSATRAAESDLANGLCITVELDSGDTDHALQILTKTLGPPTLVMASGGEWLDPETGQVFRKLHVHWRLSEPTRDAEDHARLKEARSLACMLVAADPSAKTIVHPLRWAGTWHLKAAPRLATIVTANDHAEVHLQDALEALQEAGAAAGVGQPHRQDRAPSGDPEAAIWLVESALDALPNGDAHWDTWSTDVGLAAYAATAGSEQGRVAWTRWSAKSEKFDPDACAARWKHFHGSPPTRCGFGKLHHMATEHGWWAPVSEREHLKRREQPKAGGKRTEQAQADEPPVPAEPPIWVASGGWAESEIPKRPWIAPGFLLRRAVTLLSGPPSGSKSMLALGWAVAIVLSRPYGQFRPRVQGPVLVYNVEDDAHEQQRRLSAVLRQFGASPGDMAGKLICIGPRQIGTLLVHDKHGAMVSSAALQAIEEQIRVHKPVTFLADPLSELHVEEENDNVAVRAVIAEFRSRAIEHDMAVCVAHHTRKGGSTSPGDPDVARGASAIIGAVRVAFTLTGMSEADATAFGLPTGRADREPYVRLDSAKQNYAPLGDAVWFQKHVYLLANGENVPAAVPWEPPVQKVPTEADLSALVTAIKYGAPGGEPWSPKLSRDPRSLRALLTDHGFHGDAQKAVMGKLLTECQVEQARFRSFVRKTRALGLHVGFLPAAEWLEEPSE